ncbi:hypothetical protein SNEBB_005982 [Seison nebaliae]|nr:hypothetical protein SNEBB_005982 [Seison nebaliae]
MATGRLDSEMFQEVKLYRNARERKHVDNAADLYAVINTLQSLEKAYSRDLIQPNDYTAACSRLLVQVKIAAKEAGKNLDDLSKFLAENRCQCPSALDRIRDGRPITIPGDKTGLAPAIAEIVGLFITVMDKLKLEITSKGELIHDVREISALFLKLNSIFPSDQESREKILGWYDKLNNLPLATSELNEEECREMILDRNLFFFFFNSFSYNFPDNFFLKTFSSHVNLARSMMEDERVLLVISLYEVRGIEFQFESLEIEAKFDHEQLAIDPIPCNSSQILTRILIQQELAWSLNKQQYQSHRMKRSAIKIHIYGCNGHSKKTIGYIVLNVHSGIQNAEDKKPVWNKILNCPIRQDNKSTPQIQLALYMETEEKTVNETESDFQIKDLLRNLDRTIKSKNGISSKRYDYNFISINLMSLEMYPNETLPVFVKMLTSQQLKEMKNKKEKLIRLSFNYGNWMFETKPFPIQFTIPMKIENSFTEAALNEMTMGNHLPLLDNDMLLNSSINIRIELVEDDNQFPIIGNATIEPPSTYLSSNMKNENKENFSSDKLFNLSIPVKCEEIDSYHFFGKLSLQLSFHKQQRNSPTFTTENNPTEITETETFDQFTVQEENNNNIDQNATPQNLSIFPLSKLSRKSMDKDATENIDYQKEVMTCPEISDQKKNSLPIDVHTQLHAVYELELWKKNKEKEFLVKLEFIESQRLLEMAKQFRKREHERQTFLQKKITAYSELERRSKLLFDDLQKEEEDMKKKTLKISEKQSDLRMKADKLDHEFQEERRIMMDETKHLVEIEKLKNVELEKRVEFLRSELKQTEDRLNETRKNSDQELLNLRQQIIPKESNYQTQIVKLTQENSDLSNKLMESERFKIQYKNELNRCLAELLKIRKKEARDQKKELKELKQNQKEAETIELLKKAKEESQRELENEDKKRLDNSTNRQKTGTNKDQLKDLIRERDQLLHTGLYEENDELIKRLNVAIQNYINSSTDNPLLNIIN